MQSYQTSLESRSIQITHFVYGPVLGHKHCLILSDFLSCLILPLLQTTLESDETSHRGL